MLDEELEVRIRKVVKDPKLSLKRFSQYHVATENGKKRILEGCKYPNDYVPRFYEMARTMVCDTFSANFDDHELYFEEFKRQASIYRNDAKSYPINKDAHKNRMYSANGLDAITEMSSSLIPILNRYTLNSNLKNKKSSIMQNSVRIGAMADMVLSEKPGGTQIGFLKFNFTSKELSKDEADIALLVLKTFFERQETKLDLNSGLLVDVFTGKIYRASDRPETKSALDKLTLEISSVWDLI